MSIEFVHDSILEVIESYGLIELVLTNERPCKLNNYVRLIQSHCGKRIRSVVKSGNEIISITFSNKGCFIDISKNGCSYYSDNIASIGQLVGNFEDYFIAAEELDSVKVVKLVTKLQHLGKALLLDDKIDSSLKTITGCCLN